MRAAASCGAVKEGGDWKSKPTPFSVGDESKAERYAASAQRTIDAREAGDPNAGPLTVRMFCDKWIAERQANGIASTVQDESRLRLHVIPSIGSLRIDEVKPKDMRALMWKLRKAGELSPRTIRHVYAAASTMFRDAIVEELIELSPCQLKHGDLPAKVDADPNWRGRATYTTEEVIQLVTDPRIPPERRVLYAIKVLTGLRHGESAALQWSRWNPDAAPLGKLEIAVSWCSKSNRVKRTKTGTRHDVPVHPTLARVLTVWRDELWPTVYGRPATPDDFIAPARTLRPVNAKDALEGLKHDLERLGLRVDAGELRDRGSHDMRSWFQSQAIEDGADSTIIRRLTHAPTTVNDGYERFSWAASSAS